MRVVFEGMDALEEYGQVPIGFWANARVDVTRLPEIVEIPLAAPFFKDYDALEGAGPHRWRGEFDLRNWAMISAFEAETRAGGIVLAFDSPDVDMLEGRRDLAVLWDVRVRPDLRGRGVGRALFDSALAWAKARNLRELKVETQDINVAACRFYAGMGFRVASADSDAYPELPDEIQILWRRPVFGQD